MHWLEMHCLPRLGNTYLNYRLTKLLSIKCLKYIQKLQFIFILLQQQQASHERHVMGSIRRRFLTGLLQNQQKNVSAAEPIYLSTSHFSRTKAHSTVSREITSWFLNRPLMHLYQCFADIGLYANAKMVHSLKTHLSRMEYLNKLDDISFL